MTDPVEAEDRRADILNFSVGDTIKNYRLVNQNIASESDALVPLGEGGSGSVFLAEQELIKGKSLKRVIKFFVFRDDVSYIRKIEHGSTSDENFVIEIAALSDLTHKNLVKIVDAGIHQASEVDVPYIVYDYIQGPSLKELSLPANESDGPTSEAVIYNILELCEGIAYLHKNGYHHYDIAPKNIFCNDKLNNAFVVGDLGLSIRHDTIVSTRFVIGSKEWVPPNVQKLLNSTISAEDYKSLQPSWDIFGLARSIKYYLEKVDYLANATWSKIIQREMDKIIDYPDRYSIDDVIRRIKFASPSARETAGVPELSPGLTGKQISLMPVHSLVSTERLIELTKHYSLRRLNKVPQLSAAYMHFPSGNHSRFEHSLGVTEVMRRYLMAIISQQEFISHLSEKHIETCLLAALFSNIHQFCLTTILNDGSLSEEWIPVVGKEALVNKMLKHKDHNGISLIDMVEKLFKNVDVDHLTNLLLGNAETENDILIKSMMNSSIDVRVVDYIARDSYHLGINAKTNSESEDIFQFLSIHRNKIALNVRGISAAEQIIAQRYWLFMRFYWNRPNRRYTSTLKTIVNGLGEQEEFRHGLFSRCLDFNLDETLMLLEQECDGSKEKWIRDMSPFIRGRNGNEYKIRYDQNTTTKSELNTAFSKIDAMPVRKKMEFERRLAREIFKSDESIYGAILDLPKESGLLKFGEDIMVVSDRGEESPRLLASISPIIKGIREGYEHQLRRIRVFVHPSIDIEKDKREEYSERIEDFIISRVG